MRTHTHIYINTCVYVADIYIYIYIHMYNIIYVSVIPWVVIPLVCSEALHQELGLVD